MTEATFHFSLVSPEKEIFSEDLSLVVLPGEMGDMGIMPGHAPVLTSLRAGLVRIYDDQEQVTKRYFVKQGFAEVTNERCTVLAEEAQDCAEIDKEALKAEIHAKLEEIGKLINEEHSYAAYEIQRDIDDLETLMMQL